MRYSGNSKASEFSRFDLRRLARGGFLTPGRSSVWTWSTNGTPRGSITVRAEFGRVILSYRHHWEEEWHSAEDTVPLECTPCNFGGGKSGFDAPNCQRCIAVPYGLGPFTCRHCWQFTYDSQSEAPYSRALSKAQAIRMKLNGSGNMGEDFPRKPKGMHWRTYYQLRAQAEAAEGQSWPLGC